MGSRADTDSFIDYEVSCLEMDTVKKPIRGCHARQSSTCSTVASSSDDTEPSSDESSPNEPATCADDCLSRDVSVFGKRASCGAENETVCERHGSSDSRLSTQKIKRQHSQLETLKSKEVTTIFLGQLPQCLVRADIIELLASHGLMSSCDFVYLPMNLKMLKNLGYA